MTITLRLFLSFSLGIFATHFALGQTQHSEPGASNIVEGIAAFQSRLKAQVEHPRFTEAQWGVKVVSLDTGKTLFEHNAGKLMKPASNAKMYTGALVLDRLGPDYRIKTSFYSDTTPDTNGVLKGDLIVYGRGDPSFSWRFYNGDYVKGFEPVVKALTNAGIKEIEGDLVGDESCFRCSPFGRNWAVDDLQAWYGAPVSALTVQDNVIDLFFKPGKEVGDPLQIVTKPATTFMKFENRTQTVSSNQTSNIEIYRPVGENTTYVWGQMPIDGKTQVDSVSVHNPPLWFVHMLKEALTQRGIIVKGQLRSVNCLDREINPIDCSNLVEVASIQSPPMSEVIKMMMKPSQNLYAHLLLLQVGLQKQDPSKAKTEWLDSASLAEMRKFLTEAGIKKNTVFLEEGSGLSRACLLTPGASVELLTFMAQHRHAAIFYDALPIAGVDGTLRSRFKGTAAEKNVHAKTGTIGFCSTISGYVTTRGNEKLVFSVMLNNFRETDGVSARSQTDKLVKTIADFAGHSQNP